MKRIKWLLLVALLVAGTVLAVAGQVAAAPGDGSQYQFVKFAGPVEGRPQGTVFGLWVIGGRTVQVAAGALVAEEAGPATVGAQVQVLARQYQDGRLEAATIRVQPVATPALLRVRGTITQIGPTTFTVNGLAIRWNAQTRFQGQFALGATVAADVALTPGGYVAMYVEGQLTQEHHRIAEFRDVIVSMDGSLWVVGEYELTVTEETVIDGTPEVGSLVDVRALIEPDGSLVAIVIKVVGDGRSEPVPVSFEGAIERFPAQLRGQWLIGGQAVWVTAGTEINGVPQVGLWAAVQGIRYADGLLVADRIAITGEVPEATPAPGQTPGPKQTPGGPNQTPQATPEQQRTCTPQASCTPQATCTPNGPNGPQATPTRTGTPKGR